MLTFEKETVGNSIEFFFVVVQALTPHAFICFFGNPLPPFSVFVLMDGS